jgi:hypothetical protein
MIRRVASSMNAGSANRAAVLTLVRDQYADFGLTLAVEKLAARHGLQRRKLASAGTSSGAS